MKYVPVYKEDGEYGKKLDVRLNSIEDATSPQKAQARHGSDLGRSGTVVWMPIPSGMDERALVAVEDTPGVIEVQEDTTKLTTAKQLDTDTTVNVKYDEMAVDVLADMKTLFLTEKPESANAYHETWKRMSVNPSLFSGESLTSDRKLLAADTTVLFNENDALDTDAKITSYADRLLELADEFAVSRMKRIKQFRDEKVAIEVS